MRKNRRIVAIYFLLAMFSARSAQSALIVNQPNSNPGNGRASQVFPDFPTFDIFQFDDFTLPTDTLLTNLTTFGFSAGVPNNLAVTAEIWDNLPGSFGGNLLHTFNGAQVGNNLHFNLNNQVLTAGTYWMTSYVTRVSTDGQWFSAVSLPLTGSESFVYNPGNGFGSGVNPFAGSTFFSFGPANQAFALEGVDINAIPEPGTISLLGLTVVGGAVLRLRTRRKKETQPAKSAR